MSCGTNCHGGVYNAEQHADRSHGGGSVRFTFNRRKAAQAAAYLVKLHSGKMNMMALLKLLYLADRTSLIETGQPITGDRMVNMPKGPVLSQIYDSIKWGDIEDGDPWYEYLTEQSNYEVSLAKDHSETDELSEYEIHILEKIHESYGSLHPMELVRLTHGLPEWHDPDGSSIPLEPEEILRANGKSPEEIERIARTAEEVYFLDQFARP